MLQFYILSFIQIVTESIPISSSGHVMLLSCLMKNFFEFDSNYTLAILDFISYLCTWPSLYIIPLFFFHRWWPIVVAWRRAWWQIVQLIVYGVIASTITAIGWLFRSWLFNKIPLWVGFSLTGVILFSLYFCSSPGSKKKLSVSYAIAFGIIQTIALIPGLSRFGIVYAAARWLGFDAPRAFEITWLIQWPLIVGAAGLSLRVLVMPTISFFSPMLFLIMIVSSIVSYLFLYLMYRLAIAHYLWLISFYMIIPLILSCYCAN